jgi:pimeloyl-ACP methyl ester carboxylesterase
MQLDFFDACEGPALLFLPGSYSSASAWKAILGHLTGSYRTFTTSLPGYGETPKTRTGDNGDLTAALDFVVNLVERIGSPVHLVGHSYGGFTAIAATLTGKVAPLSLVTFEGNPTYSRPGDRPFDWRPDVDDIKDRFTEAVRVQHPDAAEIIIDFWGHAGLFKSMPLGFQEFCRSKAATNLRDWQTAAWFAPDFSAFSQLTMPCTIARGELANRAIIDVSDNIVANAPNASLYIEPGAGHFLKSSHPAECAAVIDKHMQQFSGPLS